MKPPLLVRLALQVVPRAWRAAVTHDLYQDFGPPAGAAASLRCALHALRAGLRLRIARAHDAALSGDSMTRDIRYAIRMLRRAPGLSAVIVLTLALGIGANTAIFSVVNTLLLDPLPYPAADRLVGLTFDNETPLGGQRWPYPKFTALASELPAVFEGVAAYGETSLTIHNGGDPERVQTEVVSATYFPLLGVQAAHGRVFRPDEDRNPGEHALVILSHDLWRRSFRADTAVLGRSVEIKGRLYQIIGVMPSWFRGQSGLVEMWIPGMMADHAMHRGAATGAFSWWVRVMARLRPGVSVEQVQAAMPAVTARVQELAPATSTTMARRDGTQLFKVVPFKRLKIDPQVSRTFVLFLVAVGLVLLIACANTANLLVGRAVAREREFLVRRALGASRGVIFRQVAVESLMLALAGGAAGLFVAHAGLQWLTTEKPWTSAGFWSEYARTFEYFSFALDARVLLFTLAVSVGVGLLFGLAPALQAGREHGMRAGTGTRTRAVLAFSEVALSLVLLISAGLMIRSFARVSHADLGFDPSNTISMSIGAGAARTPAYYRDVLSRVGALPGVESATLSVGRPLFDAGWRGPVWLGETRTRDTPEVESAVNAVTPGYFTTHRLRLASGRALTERDDASAPRVAVVSKAFAGTAWPGGHAIGQRIISDLVSRTPMEVVGVVDDVTYTSIEERADPVVYVSAWQTSPRLLSPNALSVRASVTSAPLSRSIRETVQSVDRTVAVYGVSTLADRASRVTSRYRYSAVLVGAVASLALFLAATGIYGVMAFAMTSRRKEIAIRIALGASPRDVLAMAVGGGLRLSALGIAAGLAGAYIATRALTSLLYGVDPADATTFAAVAVLMVMVSAAASYVPARRALRIDPVQALKAE